MLKRLLLLASLTGALLPAHAQRDVEFWFAAPEVAASHGDEPIRLRLSAFGQSAQVTLSLPADPSFAPRSLSLAANEAQTLELTQFKALLENSSAASVQKKGMLIQASAPIAAYYEVSAGNNMEIFLLKGGNALGRRFFLPSQRAFPNQHGSESAEIVATRDNTRITITLRGQALGHASGTPFTIFLNRGETYSLRASGTDALSSLGGSYIEADKPIAVTGSDDSIRIGGGWDLIGDQLVPVELTGTEYIAVRGLSNAEQVYITATQDGTRIFVNGSSVPAATLGVGQTHELILSGPSTFIEGSAPVYVYHLSGIGNEAGSALLPPLNCTGAEQVGFIRGFGTNSLILLTQSGNQGHFVINGDSSAISASAFAPVPGSAGQWVAARIDASSLLSSGSINLVRNTRGLFHLGLLNTSGSGASYGYFSQFNDLYFGGQISICKGDTATLDAGPDRSAILWSNGSRERYLRVTEPGIYWATVTYQTCTATDTVEVEVIDVPLDLGPDTSFCSGETLLLTAGREKGRYLWQDGSFGREYLASEPGTYHVALTQDGCTVRDTVELAMRPTPDPQLGPDTALCRWQDYVLDASTPGGRYRWQDGSQEARIRVQDAGLYWVEVEAEGCTGRDTMRNRAVFEFLNLGPDTLLCEGEELRYDLSFPDTEYRWQDGSQSAVYAISEPGFYHVTVDNGCQTFRDSVEVSYSDCGCAVHLASAFSPNSDGTNDRFGAACHCALSDFELRIYNRWGQEVFATRSPEESWDGSAGGRPCPPGVYVWVMNYEGSLMRRPWRQFKQGTVTLLR
jgi:gliding motility-associated-like protein